MIKKLLVITFILSIGLFPATALTFTVTNCGQAGPGSLRYEVDQANANPGADAIEFNIPTTEAGLTTEAGYNWWRIPFDNIDSTIVITGDATTIDGSTQPKPAGFTWPAGPVIQLGALDALSYDGIRISANNCLIRSINMTMMPHAGFQFGFDDAIEINGNNNTISGCILGLTPSGEGAAHGNVNQIRISGSGNIIGGTTAAARNIISQSWSACIYVTGANNRIIGNYIGTDLTGTKDYGSALSSGVSLLGPSNEVGGSLETERNIISGHTYFGVSLSSLTAAYNKVRGNYIGTDVSGSNAISNGVGIALSSLAHYNQIGGQGQFDGNVVGFSDNSLDPQLGVGIGCLGSVYNYFQGNYVGVNRSGGAIPNDSIGVAFASGASYESFGPGNIVKNSASYGVFVSPECQFILITQNTIESNALDGIFISPGANNNIAYPGIATAEYFNHSGQVIASGTSPASAVIEFFMVPATPDPSGRGEAAYYLGSTEANSSGIWSATLESLSLGDTITATSSIYLSPGYTSEFAENYIVVQGTTTTTTTTTATTTITGTTSTTTTSTTTTTIDGQPPEVIMLIEGAAIKSCDYIGKRPAVEAEITDNTSIDAGSVRAYIDGQESSYITTAFSGQAMAIRFMPADDLSVGDHILKVLANDIYGNAGWQELNELEVSSENVRVVNDVLVSPSTYTGGNVSLAYTLNTDSAIRLHLIGPDGTVRWTRSFSAGSMGGKAGYNIVAFNGVTDLAGQQLGNGIYVIMLVANGRNIGKGHLVVFE
ncbi:MAG: hypothetical protein JW782_00570 [Candidatus Saganbacteria bacterium]|nr:hypothetical protein [Candidatus Saganbacteria bacterium]